MFAIDTNILVYAHNKASVFNHQAAAFLQRVMNERDENGNFFVCIPAQVLMEFIHVVTWQRLEKPLSLAEAIQIVEDYIETGIEVIYQQETQITTFLALLSNIKTRRKVFDVALAATLKDNGVSGLFTVNVNDFKGFDFLQVVNPLREEST
ncbi:MAG TPA: PIN domain-containing protein [Anaerolineae bacterium]|nr:PIN domain-containing protein [Anaerolineae bacterium]